MDCCELALYNGRLAFWIAISAFVTIALLLLMLFGYNLWLDKRTIKLEKKNGHEQAQIDELKRKLTKLEQKT